MPNIDITPFQKSGQVESAEQSGDNIRVLIRASSPKKDLDGDVFLPEAWSNPEDREFFLSRGVIDWNHLHPINKKLAAEALRNRDSVALQEAEANALGAIMGHPTDLYIENDYLYCKALLYPGKQFVREYKEALIANSDRFGASVCGVSYPSSQITKSKYGSHAVDRARLSSISVCLLSEARNDDSMTTVLKSGILLSLVGNNEDGPLEIQKGYSEPSETPVEHSLPWKINRFRLFENFITTRNEFADYVMSQVSGFVQEREHRPSYDELRSYLLDMGLTADEVAELSDGLYSKYCLERNLN